MTNNNLHGKFELIGLPSVPSDISQIEVTFDIDATGTLNVSTVDKSTKENKITIDNHKGLLSKKDNAWMVQEAWKCKLEEKQRDKVLP